MRKITWMLLLVLGGCKSPPPARLHIEAQHNNLLTSSSCKVSFQIGG